MACEIKNTVNQVERIVSGVKSEVSAEKFFSDRSRKDETRPWIGIYQSES